MMTWGQQKIFPKQHGNWSLCLAQAVLGQGVKSRRGEFQKQDPKTVLVAKNKNHDPRPEQASSEGRSLALGEPVTDDMSSLRSCANLPAVCLDRKASYNSVTRALPASFFRQVTSSRLWVKPPYWETHRDTGWWRPTVRWMTVCAAVSGWTCSGLNPLRQPIFFSNC